MPRVSVHTSRTTQPLWASRIPHHRYHHKKRQRGEGTPGFLWHTHEECVSGPKEGDADSRRAPIYRSWNQQEHSGRDLYRAYDRPKPIGISPRHEMLDVALSTQQLRPPRKQKHRCQETRHPNGYPDRFDPHRHATFQAAPVIRDVSTDSRRPQDSQRLFDWLIAVCVQGLRGGSTDGPATT
jgi:hypothetical protein